MRTFHILLLCMLGATLVSLVACNAAIGPDNCCFTFYPRRVKKNLIISYDVTDFRCPKTGVVFVTQKSRRICVDPSLSWVQCIMKNVDENTF
ncbi:C-C motif chemokine 3-like [Seriola lalandi dorsalis]|uniref:C-C motif chemokine 3-like n=1 Tax=Seriola lalandi dorsalis TaxID=1841481 RepID=A0A3B4Y329_SERLL|nr:C-C motif chemokine 3-like [Seriola lalandi dorsalis]